MILLFSHNPFEPPPWIMLVQQQIIIPLQAQAFTGCSLSLKRSQDILTLLQWLQTFFCSVLGALVNFSEIKAGNQVHQCHRSFEHFNAKGFRKHSATPNIHHLYSPREACQKASQGQMWTTCEENIACTRSKLNALKPSKTFSVNIWSSATLFQTGRNSSDSRIKFHLVVHT